MTLYDILNIVNFLINEKRADRDVLTRGQFNRLIRVKNLEKFTYEVDQKNFGNLRPFTVVMGENNTMPMVIDQNGLALKPNNYYMTRSISHSYLKNGQLRVAPIPLVEDEKWDDILSSSIEYPTREYPVANIKADYIRFRPKDLRYATFTYIQTPQTPEMAIKVINGYNQYDANNSSELQWDENLQVDLIDMLLRDLGISMKREDLVNIAENEEVKKIKSDLA